MKNFAHRLLNKLGIEVRLIRNLKAAHLAAKRDQEVNAWRVLEHHDFAIVLDIGANEGQFATMARRLGPRLSCMRSSRFPTCMRRWSRISGTIPCWCRTTWRLQRNPVHR